MGEKAKEATGGQPSEHTNSKEDNLVPRIVNVDEAPAYLIDNKYLIRGYRKNFSRFIDIMKSLFMAHNETWNIWTHFAGSLVLIWVLYYLLTVYLPHDSVIVHLKELAFKKPTLEVSLQEIRQSIPDCHSSSYSSVGIHELENPSQGHLCSYLGSIMSQKFDSSFIHLHSSVVQGLESSRKAVESKSLIDSIMHSLHLDELDESLEMWPMVFHILCSLMCLGGSTVFHTFGCKSAGVYKYLRRLDMAGVNFALVGGFLPISYYNFYCNSWLVSFYTTAQVLSFLTLQVCSFQDWFYLRESVKLRSNLFTISGIFSSIPLVHGLLASFAASKDNDFIPFYEFAGNCIIAGVCGLVGVQFYKYKFPECLAPGRFDVWLNSHTIWHFFVMAAFYFESLCVFDTYRYRLLKRCKA